MPTPPHSDGTQPVDFAFVIEETEKQLQAAEAHFNFLEESLSQLTASHDQQESILKSIQSMPEFEKIQEMSDTEYVQLGLDTAEFHERATRILELTQDLPEWIEGPNPKKMHLSNKKPKIKI